jgi:hypothetical protein
VGARISSATIVSDNPGLAMGLREELQKFPAMSFISHARNDVGFPGFGGERGLLLRDANLED